MVRLKVSASSKSLWLSLRTKNPHRAHQNPQPSDSDLKAATSRYEKEAEVSSVYGWEADGKFPELLSVRYSPAFQMYSRCKALRLRLVKIPAEKPCQPHLLSLRSGWLCDKIRKE